LALDAKAGDARGEAFDWFNYGQFLWRHGMPDDLVYACFLRAETLLTPSGGPELAAVQNARSQLESRLGKKARSTQTNLPSQLASAATLSTSSF
jgi:hypothetical protein